MSDLAPTVQVTEGLSERQRQILAFAKAWWKHAGAKETAIRRHRCRVLPLIPAVRPAAVRRSTIT